MEVNFIDDKYLIDLIENREIEENFKSLLNFNNFNSNDSNKYRINIKSKNIQQRTYNLIINSLNKIIKIHTKWFVELRRPTVEICVHQTSDGLFVGIPISLLPISTRPYCIGLRTPVAYSMLFLLTKYCSSLSLVCDTFCGKGTLLCEASSDYFIFGSDIDLFELKIAKKNLQNSFFQDLFQGTVKNLPFRCGVFDAIISDIPFGNKHMKLLDVYCSLENWIESFYSLLRPQGLAVLLVSCTIIDILLYYTTRETFIDDHSSQYAPSWRKLDFHFLSLGKLEACISYKY
ncbi:hypothetical protein HZS_1895 [Henneguya salminicola]|nr:hypothetical protein HZS_1895 [Henneguya salminicola]